MKELTQAQAVSQARKVAKENGLVLRKANVLLAGTPAYRFYDRQTGEKKSNLMTLRCIKEFANNSSEPWTSLSIKGYVMKTLSLNELKNEAVRFTVKATDGRTGTLTYSNFDGKSPIGETHQVMFTDEMGNKMGFYGEIAEITKVEIYEYEFKEIELF